MGLATNSDAHGKNISCHVGRDGLNVAELYYLVSVMQYDASKLEHTFQWVCAAHQSSARRC
jgi:hypothetical protein